MASKISPEDIELFKSFGCEGALKKIDENPALGVALKSVIESSGISPDNVEKGVGNLLFTIASTIPENRAHRRAFIAKYVSAKKIVNAAQVNAAVDFMKKKVPDAAIDEAEFEKAAGVGITFTEEEIVAHVKKTIGEVMDVLVVERYVFPKHSLVPKLKAGDWKFADGSLLMTVFDKEYSEILGPMTDEDKVAIANSKNKTKSTNPKAEGKQKDDSKANKKDEIKEASPATVTSPGVVKVDEVESKFAARELASAVNTPELIADHTKITNGVIRTRFPPEPNGFLHIGHAKSMKLNFDLVFRTLGADKGETIFRYDDTNPETEAPIYVKSQAENVSWMGWKPVRVTHSSDYFDELYEFAIELIKKGKAYVCHQTRQEMEISREISRARDGRNPNSPWRDTPVEENLRKFEDMKNGKYEEGAATLRLKIDMTSSNPTLWDPVAYRIKYTPHQNTGDKWCIYPAYDYTHCICDSLEHIDYSLCTLEFEVRRDLYYWILEQLNLWRPHVWEFSRLNITYVQLSKRKILKLVGENKVRGWDDPRIPTINGMRRRGFTAKAINDFCAEIGVTRNENLVDFRMLEYHTRQDLDQIAKRDFLVTYPLEVEMVNVPDDYFIECDAPDFPRDKSLGMHKIPLTKTFWIDKEDFRMVDDKSYYGLAPGKTAGLRYAGYVTVVDVKTDDAGEPVKLFVEYDHGRTRPGKVKGNLHWVSSAAPGAGPTTVEVRLYDHLFTTEVPGSTGDWESELNPNSEVIVTGYVNPYLVKDGNLKQFDHFQFERVGYFVVDQDSDFENKKFVFNLTVGLKEATEVKKLKEQK